MAGRIKQAWNQFGAFCRNHKGQIIAGLVGLAAVGAAVVVSKNAEKNDGTNDQLASLTDSLSPSKEMNWNEEKYRGNWDKVNAFAKDLKLGEQEAYYIEDASGWDDTPPGERNIVSHLVGGDGVYPAE